MGIQAEIRRYTRFTLGLRNYPHHTISLDQARSIVRRRMADRDKNFLNLVKRGIFGYSKSPYLALLKLAGCEMGDIENMVRNKGLEDTLRTLRESGTYVTFEEYKSRAPIVRGGQTFSLGAHDFDNPFLSKYYYGESGGTTGTGTRASMDLDHLASQAPYHMLTQEVHGVLDAPTALWFGVLPDATGLNNILRRIPFKNIPRKWFVPTTGPDFKPSLKDWAATRYIVGMGRLFSMPMPWPEPVPLDQAVVVARWAAQTIKTDGFCLINTHVSKALRVCLAAQEAGLELKGATFMISGEPPTPAKVREIIRTGAKYIPSYNFAEIGIVGHGCAHPIDTNDIHFFKDSFALIQYPRQVPGFEVSVDAFYFTTLLPTAPKLLLNVESDDYGVIETCSCGCPWETYGLTDHLRQIRSFRKLTSEGVTLIGSEMIYILEEVLPTWFGGSLLDYQLAEEEDEKGFTRLKLLISPGVNNIDEKSVIDVVMEGLKHSSRGANMAQAIWNRAKTIQIKRIDPIWTSRGKLMPLHFVRQSGH